MSSQPPDMPSPYGPLQLLILQGNSFCNINCKYCYLPNRHLNSKMSIEVVEAAVNFVLAAGIVGKEITVVWHAGEPLAVPITFYEEAIQVIEKLMAGRTIVTHSVQTNATLITPAWCEFLARHQFKVGVSIDGPAFLHDASRVTRTGKGTFTRTMRGIDLLTQSAIKFHVIAVLTRESLAYADDLFDFFRQRGMNRFGFNIEEVEGPNTSSSIVGGPKSEAEYVAFVRRLMERSHSTQSDSCGEPFIVREFSTMDRNIRAQASRTAFTQGQESTPFAILSVDSAGNLSTFSPELIGNMGSAYSGFNFGNVLRDNFQDVVQNPAFRAASLDIGHGVEMCRRECPYFSICGGGAPSNKYFENGKFDSTQTIHCRYKIQIIAEEVLDSIEASLA